jgi:hypothetical protein
MDVPPDSLRGGTPNGHPVEREWLVPEHHVGTYRWIPHVTVPARPDTFACVIAYVQQSYSD